jgi:predicted PurR-regulated permease PerM
MMRWALPVLAAVAALTGLWAARAFVIPLVCALVMGVLLWPAVRWLDRVLRVRALSALVAVGATLAIVAGLVAVVGLQLSDAADETPHALRLVARDIGSLNSADRTRAMQRARAALLELDRSVARATGTGPAPREADAASGSLVAWLVDAAAELAVEASKSLAGVTLQVGVMALLTFFGLCSAEHLAARLRAACGLLAARPEHCAPLLDEAARQIRLFGGVTVVTNIVIGFGVAAIFALFRVPDAWSWGLTAAVLHFVPYAGLAIVMALAALEVYVVQASLGAALLAATCVAGVGVAVGTAMSVWLQGRAARVDSATLFAGTVFWSVLWGGWGLMLGPLLVVVMRLAWLRAPALAERPAAPPADTPQAPASGSAPAPAACGEVLQADAAK